MIVTNPDRYSLPLMLPIAIYAYELLRAVELKLAVQYCSHTLRYGPQGFIQDFGPTLPGDIQYVCSASSFGNGVT